MNQLLLNKRMKRWERIRKPGRVKYSFFYGMLSGFVFAIVHPLVNKLLHIESPGHLSLVGQYFSYPTLFKFLFFGLVMSSYYFYQWQKTEKNYRDWLLQKKREKP